MNLLSPLNIVPPPALEAAAKLSDRYLTEEGRKNFFEGTAVPDDSVIEVVPETWMTWSKWAMIQQALDRPLRADGSPDIAFVVAVAAVALAAAWRISLAGGDSSDHWCHISRHVANGCDAKPTLPRFTAGKTC